MISTEIIGTRNKQSVWLVLMCVMTINESRDHEFEKEQGRLYMRGRGGRKGKRNDVIKI